MLCGKLSYAINAQKRSPGTGDVLGPVGSGSYHPSGKRQGPSKAAIVAKIGVCKKERKWKMASHCKKIVTRSLSLESLGFAYIFPEEDT